jgi:hypothetical protein
MTDSRRKSQGRLTSTGANLRISLLQSDGEDKGQESFLFTSELRDFTSFGGESPDE